MHTDWGSRQHFHLLEVWPEVATLYFNVLICKMDVPERTHILTLLLKE